MDKRFLQQRIVQDQKVMWTQYVEYSHSADTYVIHKCNDTGHCDMSVRMYDHICTYVAFGCKINTYVRMYHHVLLYYVSLLPLYY